MHLTLQQLDDDQAIIGNIGPLDDYYQVEGFTNDNKLVKNMPVKPKRITSAAQPVRK